MDDSAPAVVETPRNGIAGLKHWRQDVLAGLVVSMISVPFSLGIAVASGAPPICGLISAIVAGLVLPFLGGSFVTISGPAAGLAPALLAGMMLLGKGDVTVGYPLLLVAIFLTGVAQVILAYFKAARFGAIFPASVVEGMLAAIGLLIIAKQLSPLLGQKFHAHEFWEIVGEAPKQFLAMQPKVFLIGLATLILIFVLSSVKSRWLRILPPQVFAAIFGLIIGQVVGLDPKFMVDLPAHPFSHGIVLPHFAGVMSDRSLWWGVFTIVLTLTLIDGVESLATIAAIDRIDPFRRKSDPNRTLMAMGVSNVCSSLVGGLTIIPGGVKSTTSIVAGGRTQWANFYNALFLILYLLVGRGVINMMPLSALGAVMIYTGYKLCAPRVWKHIAHIGSEQLFVFTTTVLVTVSTDLLWGIVGGLLAKLLLEAAIQFKVVRGRGQGRQPVLPAARRWLSQTGELFRNPVVQRGVVGETYHVVFGRPLVCFNALHLEQELDRVPREVSSVCLHVTDLVTLVDHTTAAALLDFAEDFKRTGRGSARISGLDRLKGHSHAASCLRVNAPVLERELARARQELAGLRLSPADAESDDPIALIERISLTHLGPVDTAGGNRIVEVVIGAAYSVVRTAEASLDAVGSVLDRDGAEDYQTIRDLAWIGLHPAQRPKRPRAVELLSISEVVDPDPFYNRGRTENQPRYM